MNFTVTRSSSRKGSTHQHKWLISPQYYTELFPIFVILYTFFVITVLGERVRRHGRPIIKSATSLVRAPCALASFMRWDFHLRLLRGKGLTLVLVVKDLLLYPTVASYAGVSEHSPCLLNQRHFSDATYCSVTGRIEQVNSRYCYSWDTLW